MGVQGPAGSPWGSGELWGFTLSAKVALSDEAGSLGLYSAPLAAGWARCQARVEGVQVTHQARGHGGCSEQRRGEKGGILNTFYFILFFSEYILRDMSEKEESEKIPELWA